MSVYWKILTATIVAIYPFAIFFGLEHFQPRYLAILLLVVLIIRILSSNKLEAMNKKISRAALFITALLILIIVIFNSIDVLKLYPVLVNLTLLLVFGSSLFFPPTTIEKLARMKDPNLSQEGIDYTRIITQIWCGFFILNASIAFYSAIYASIEIWTLYNGFIAYILMAFLFVGEQLYRKLVLKIKV